jgi:hypothetical protein
MTKKPFTDDEMRALSGNPNVARCGRVSVRYARSFKAAALRQYNEDGLSAVEIFQNAGIDLGIIGVRAPNRIMHQWRKALRTEPEAMPDVPRKPNDNVKMLRDQVAYLKAENDFLARLRARKEK